ncbi:response regulator transcription factor [Paenibacillus beijingensis]|uniref:AraC family transcriptional regulator n=1 Tax=Paenibacillus beijingensis TaxID=1126833 RepID=A0A0D5NGH1_9BACL|nr:response regulator [Paenibacillus beijingensis]AJY74210.1 hypothetical protein VN24_06015 [Paenibacillus beijingensis]
MKVLIVDDEEHVREGIELAVDWDQFGIAERLTAENGIEAMEMIRLHKPAVLFCDMSMPGMDGTELLRLLREESWDTQVIVVSGYDHYSYTRAALRADGVDYLLKPFRKSDLEQALARAVKAWKRQESTLREERERGHKLRQADALLDEHKLAAYFKGETSFHDGIREIFYKIGLSVQHVGVAFVLPCNRSALVDRRYFGDGELFYFAVNNIAHETLTPLGSHYLCRLDDYQWMLLVSPERGPRTADEYRRYMNRVTEAWRQTLGLETLIGLSGAGASADTLPAAIGASRSSLLKCDLLASGSPSKPGKEAPRLADQYILLQAAMKNGNKAYAAEIIRSFTGMLRQRGTLTLKELQVYTLEANVLLERASRPGMSGNDDADFSMPQWIGDLNEWERLFIQTWWRLMEQGAGDGGSRGIETIRQYILEHFQEDLSLSTLSERFHFSPQYIAKKFKELYHTTVMTYLTELRVEKAGSLLAHTDMPVAEMASVLGYADENYFGKVFKKHTGLSPLQFRKQRRHS